MTRLTLLILALLISACDNDNRPQPDIPARAEAAPLNSNASEQDNARQLTVYKSPTCGCCTAWIEYMEAHGYSVIAHDHDDMQAIKVRAGLPAGHGSCHTAFIDGYAIEGHVPAADVDRLLAERPEARGLTVPGMPVGSPGMEMGERQDPYQVLLFDEQGSRVFSEYHQPGTE